MIKSELVTIFSVAELDSSTIFNSITFLLIESDLLEETIVVDKFCFLIALALLVWLRSNLASLRRSPVRLFLVS